MESQVTSPTRSRNVLLISSLAIILLVYVSYWTLHSSSQQPAELQHSSFSRNSFPWAPASEHPLTSSGTRKVAQNSDRPCTFKLFREYFADYGYFPADGTWDMKTQPNRYQPGLCKFKYPNMPREEVTKCLTGSDISSVTTTGDSNAMRYFGAMKSYIGNCKVSKREEQVGNGFVPDKKYYRSMNRSDTEWEEELEIHERHCSGCASELSMCKVSSIVDKHEKLIATEHLAMTMIIDDSLQVRFPLTRKGVHSLDNLWAITTQETLFRYYMKDRFPDVLIVFFPSNHAKHLGMERLRIDMEYFKSLVHLYIPRTTKIFYFATFSEFESKRKGKQWINATFENMLAAEKIDKMNHLMADVFRDDFLNTSQNAYPFLDMVSVSRTLESWSLDGVHMAPQWYQSVMSMFWETLCNSVKLNEF